MIRILGNLSSKLESRGFIECFQSKRYIFEEVFLNECSPLVEIVNYYYNREEDLSLLSKINWIKRRYDELSGFFKAASRVVKELLYTNELEYATFKILCLELSLLNSSRFEKLAVRLCDLCSMILYYHRHGSDDGIVLKLKDIKNTSMRHEIKGIPLTVRDGKHQGNTIRVLTWSGTVCNVLMNDKRTKISSHKKVSII